jgi:hypothetical protein
MEQYGAAWSSLEHFGAAMEQLWSSYGVAKEHLEQLWSTWSSYGAAMEHLDRVELARPNCCRCDVPSSVAAEVVSGVVYPLLCPLLILSPVSSRLLNSLALLCFYCYLLY